MTTISPSSKLFAQVATQMARAVGRPITFLLCCGLVLVWAITGPFFHYSDTWQLVINTGTTIITFLMVFLIQNTQNRDSAALQAKLDELIRASAAQNFYIGIEDLTQDELEEIRERCKKKAAHEVVMDRAQEKANARANEAAQSVS